MSEIGRRKVSRRLVSLIATTTLAVGGFVAQGMEPAQAVDRLNKVHQFKDTDYAIPDGNVLWVAVDGNDSNSGAKGSPLKTIGAAVKKAGAGYTIVVNSGIYREPHFFVSEKPNLTIQAAPHAEVWLKGSDVVDAARWQKEGNVWKVTGDFHNMCHVCTTNPDPNVEGVAAFPEQVFIDDKPLRQVASKAEVVEGTFYVEDATPTTMKVPGNNRAGLNVGAQDKVTYYVGSNPTAGLAEISERPRAFTAVSPNFSWKGINVAQYSPVQEWNFDSPKYPGINGPVAASINLENSLVQDSIFAQNSSVGLFLDSSQNTRVVGNTFVENGANGAGANKAHGASFEANTFSNNNVAGFQTNGKACGAYCGVSDVKVTHVENFTFRDNVVDYSQLGRESSQADNARAHQTAGFWCDEGCINTTIVGNFFTNVPWAIFYEVSGKAVIASNIVEGSGTGIRISSSNDVKVYNNTVSRTFRPIDLFEDWRINGCNHYANGKCEAPEKWSMGKGLRWDLDNIELYNNIVSSRSWTPNDGDGPYWSYPVRALGGSNQDGTAVVTNDMFKGFDYNAYYRSSAQNEPGLFTWDFPGGHPIDQVYKSAGEISKDGRISGGIDGRDAHALDLFGPREQNPFFVSEAPGNGDYKKSNYNIKPGSPAEKSGKPLPGDVAKAIDPTGNTVKPGVAVNRGALVNPMMNAAGN